MDLDNLFGSQIELGELALSKAVAVARLVADGRLRYARLRNTHRDDAAQETLVLDLDVEVPQMRVHSIQSTEPVAVRFDPKDRRAPEVFALRRDFPRAPHLNLTSTEYPKSLCLYDQTWSVQKLRWTPATFVERIREWLALTARGELHGADQPLEPILMEWEARLILPAGVLQNATPGEPIRLYVDAISDRPHGGVLLARGLSDHPSNRDSAKMVATLFACKPQEHGVIRRAPHSIEDLHALATAAGLDLKVQLQDLLRRWREHRDIYGARLVILLYLPKLRSAGAEVEDFDIWAFATHLTIRELGAALNAWVLQGEHTVPVLGEPERVGACEQLRLSILNPQVTLTPRAAARLNGISPPEDVPVTAIGAGAIGSQVLLNLARCGFGIWTILDDDLLLPHNLARHALDGFSIGVPKAVALAHTMNSLHEPDTPAKAIVADVLDAGPHSQAVDAALTDAACVVDLSASVPVSRFLARSSVPKRSLSLFLNPSGTDLVLLAESSDRALRLDHLEHQLYRAVLSEPALAKHFPSDVERFRYAQSCRDLSSTVPQHLVGLHASIASAALRDAIASPNAAIRIWRANSDMAIDAITIVPSPVTEHAVGEWTVCIDTALIAEIRHLRQSKLPNETGGVLIGSFDLERKIAYLVDTIPSPPDSEEWPTLYIRGSAGLANQVREVGTRTAGMLQYVGEWHSHPRGVPPLPSRDDCTVFAWLSELMDLDGFPAIMLIAADAHEAVYVCKMVQGREPL